MRYVFHAMVAAIVLMAGLAATTAAQGQSVMSSDEIARKLGGGGAAQPPSGVKLRQITVGPAQSAPAAPAQSAPAQAVSPAQAAPMVQTAPSAGMADEDQPSSKKTKKASAAPAAPAAQASSGGASVMLYINFKSGSTDLADPGARVQLDNLGKALALPEMAAATFEIGGHTDSIGGEGYNMNLSQQRANFIKNYIVSNYGVAGARLKAVGYGKNSPVASNDSEDGRAKNRRVVVTRLN